MAAQPNVFGIQEDSAKPGPSTVYRKLAFQDLQSDASLTEAAARYPGFLAQSGSQVFDLAPQDLQDTSLDAIRESLNALLAHKFSGAAITLLGIAPENRVSSQIIEEIEQLRAGVEDEVMPTQFAYQNAYTVIQSAYSQADPGRNVPRFNPVPWATTDDAGGIRVIWNFGARKLRANFGARPDLETYLYHESDTDSDAEPLDPESLKSRLKWLTER